MLAISFLLSCSFIAFASPAYNNNLSATTDKGFYRFSGNGRYDTMSKIVNEAFAYDTSLEGKPCILARGDDYPDALAATALAGLFDGAIVLTPSNASTLPDGTKNALLQLKPSDIYVPGNSIAKNLIQEAVALNPGCTYHNPIAGSNRTETSLKIYEAGKSGFTSSWGDTLIVAYSYGFADALSISPFAYKKHCPIFLTDNNKNLTANELNKIKTDGNFSKAIIVGGEASVSAKTESELESILGKGSCTRLGGSGRISTSTLIAQYCEQQGVLSYKHLSVARADDFPDALSMAPLCAKANSALMLSYPDKDFYNVEATVQNNRETMEKCYIAGGDVSISPRVFNELTQTISLPQIVPYICFTAENPSGTTIGMRNCKFDAIHLQVNYSDPSDDSAWSDFDVPATSEVTEFNRLNYGEKLYVRGQNSSIGGQFAYLACYFEFTEKASCIGDLRALLDYNKLKNGIEPDLTPYCFKSAFSMCNLVVPPSLPAITLANGCYASMFDSCKSLVVAPKLPATTLANDCYSNMFASCTSLVNAPQLQATNLASKCYYFMFLMCTSLVKGPNLPATTLKESCYCGMFADCYGLVRAPELPASTLATDCYDRTLYHCS
ncbi:MAG: cell wall-binding repeat-containing protein, partial [Coriobacteriales bacterium]|nr:cell wall-binding repeat-containing protein [Coriobacteriales bacterium]